MNKTKVLKELQKQLPNNPHRFGSADSVKEWEAAGTPYSWVVTQEFKNITLLDDVGYGLMALIVGSEVVEVDKDFVGSPEQGVIGVNGPYYDIGNKSKLFIDVNKK